MEGLIVFWIVCGIVAAIIGSRKGSGCSAFIVGLALGPLGIIVAIIMKGDRQQCPSCQEYIDKYASKCPKCHEDLKKIDAPVIISCEPSIEDETKKCPVCAEQIKFEAIKCRFCGHDYDPTVVETEVIKWKKALKERMGEYVSQEGVQGEAFCLGCRTTGPRSTMLYNEKLNAFYHIGCIPK